MSNTPINDGGSAFPLYGWLSNDDAVRQARPDLGMSLRDYFAAKAMQGIMANPSTSLGASPSAPVVNEMCRAVAILSYRISDAMLAAKKESSSG